MWKGKRKSGRERERERERRRERGREGRWERDRIREKLLTQLCEFHVYNFVSSHSKY